MASSRGTKITMSNILDKIGSRTLQHAWKNPVHSVTQDLPTEDINKKLDSLVAAMGQLRSQAPPPPPRREQRPPRDRATLAKPEANWMDGACWHSGKKHAGGRRQCLSFKAFIRRHGGLPKDYEGGICNMVQGKQPQAQCREVSSGSIRRLRLHHCFFRAKGCRRWP